jgi:acetylglutamate kinase
VAAINAAGAPAAGLCGADARLITCRFSAPDLGFVGEPVSVDPRVLNALVDAGIIPVVGPIGVVPGEANDQLVNINADTVAGNVAAAVGASRLVFLTDVEGVRGADGKVLTSLAPARARELIADGTIAGGMIPKVEACLHAASLGVSVQIVDGRNSGMLLATAGAGTTVSPD